GHVSDVVRGSVRATGQPGQLPGRVPAGGTRPTEVGVVDGDDLAVRVDAAAAVHQDGWAEVVIAVLVPAHELEPHRSADELRHDRGRLRTLIAARALPEGAPALEVPEPNQVRRQPEGRGQLRPRAS